MLEPEWEISSLAKKAVQGDFEGGTKALKNHVLKGSLPKCVEFEVPSFKFSFRSAWLAWMSCDVIMLYFTSLGHTVVKCTMLTASDWTYRSCVRPSDVTDRLLSSERIKTQTQHLAHDEI